MTFSTVEHYDQDGNVTYTTRQGTLYVYSDDCELIIMYRGDDIIQRWYVNEDMAPLQ